MGKVALITGANRGIGFETAKALGSSGIELMIGCRDEAKGEAAAKDLQALGYQAQAIVYDANNAAQSADAIYQAIEQQYGQLDILVNNAGMLAEQLMGDNTSSTVTQDVLQETFQVNLFSIVTLTQTLLPLIKKSDAGRIVNLSSVLASLALHSMENSPVGPAKAFAYNASKTALNAYTIHLADDLKDTNIKVNAAHPGWVKTELGGPQAPMHVMDSYKTSLRLATLEADGPSGGFFHESDTLPW